MKNIYQNSTGEKPSGFTFIELMVTMSLFILLASVGLGAYFQYYSFSLINNDVTKTQGLMKNTRFKALKNPDSSDYGIHIDEVSNEIISFKDPFNPSDDTNVILKLEQLTITDLNLMPTQGTTNEVIFEALTSKTQNTGSFSIGNGDFEYTFNINAQGTIE